VIEYFSLALKGKQFMQEYNLSTIKFSDINNLITNKNYDKVVEYLLYSIFDDTAKVGNGSYDLFDLRPDYKIPKIISNHKYSENFAIIYSIKDSMNDKNFGHLIDLTNYNNKYSQFYDNNYHISSNIQLLQNLYMANVNISDTYKFIENDKTLYRKIVVKENELAELYKQFENLNTYLSVGVDNIIDFMKTENCISDHTESLKLTLKGKIASQIREVHCLVFSELLENKSFDKLTAIQIVTLLSCFTNISVSEDLKEHLPYIHDAEVNDIITKITEMYNSYQDKEMLIGLNTGIDYYMHYDLLKYLGEWCEAQNIEECKLVLQKLVVH
jgi:hypothetical protein